MGGKGRESRPGLGFGKGNREAIGRQERYSRQGADTGSTTNSDHDPEIENEALLMQGYSPRR